MKPSNPIIITSFFIIFIGIIVLCQTKSYSQSFANEANGLEEIKIDYQNPCVEFQRVIDSICYKSSLKKITTETTLILKNDPSLIDIPLLFPKELANSFWSAVGIDPQSSKEQLEWYASSYPFEQFVTDSILCDNIETLCEDIEITGYYWPTLNIYCINISIEERMEYTRVYIRDKGKLQLVQSYSLSY